MMRCVVVIGECDLMRCLLSVVGCWSAAAMESASISGQVCSAVAGHVRRHFNNEVEGVHQKLSIVGERRHIENGRTRKNSMNEASGGVDGVLCGQLSSLHFRTAGAAVRCNLQPATRRDFLSWACHTKGGVDSERCDPKPNNCTIEVAGGHKHSQTQPPFARKQHKAGDQFESAGRCFWLGSRNAHSSHREVRRQPPSLLYTHPVRRCNNTTLRLLRTGEKERSMVRPQW